MKLIFGLSQLFYVAFLKSCVMCNRNVYVTCNTKCVRHILYITYVTYITCVTYFTCVTYITCVT